MKIQNKIKIFFDKLRYPKRYMIKLRYRQRPRLLRALYRSLSLTRVPVTGTLTQADAIQALSTLERRGIAIFTSPALESLVERIDEASDKNLVDSELSSGYISKPASKTIVSLIVQELSPILKMYYGINTLPQVRGEPQFTRISRDTVNNSGGNSSTDFWHIDTPNQLTIHYFFTDSTCETPHLEYIPGSHNIDFVDYHQIKRTKNGYLKYMDDLEPHTKSLAPKGHVCLFDPGGLHRDEIPRQGNKQRVYIHINITPGNK